MLQFRITNIIILLFVSCFLGACGKKEEVRIQYQQENYKDVLNVRGMPKKVKDRTVFSFSDLGSWHSYSLPDTLSHYGSFVGPFIMTQDNGLWLAKTLAKVNLKKKDKIIDFGKATRAIHYLPGKLTQSYTWSDLILEMNLIFVSNRTAFIDVLLTNTSGKVQNLSIEWEGETWLEGVENLVEENGISLKLPNNDSRAFLRFSNYNKPKVDLVGQNYSFVFDATIQAKEELRFQQSQSVVFDGKELQKELAITDQLFAGATKKSVEDNAERWNNYLSQLLQKDQTASSQRLIVKCLNTLNNNWRSAAGELKHDGLFPSYARKWFHGFWSWDSWKHAVALVRFNPELAKEQMRTMFVYQDEYGMIADCVFRDTSIEQHNWRDTKPPLAAWAVWEIYKQTNDKNFLNEFYDKLERYHEWWYKYRDHDQNGLCEYGSTDGTRVAAGWESGMDNAVRFDSALIVQNNSISWSLNQESVDLNAYLCTEKKILSQMNVVLGNSDRATELDKEVAELEKKIQAHFYDKETGYFYDVAIENKTPLKVKGPEAWTVLWSKIATEEQAAGIKKSIEAPDEFNTFVPFPTLVANHPNFDPEKGYWRGPVWLDQVYFAIKGLEHYGYDDLAENMKTKLLQNAEGVLDSDLPLRENYHPITGKGLNANHFSWTAAHLLLLELDE